MYNSKVGTRLFEYIETVKKDSVDYFIAQALLEKLDDFPDILIEEIAYKASTTPSSITKFVKKLGYESFKEMRYDIGEYSSKLLVDSFEVSSLSQYINDFHQMELDYDEKIIQSIDHQIIIDLVEKLNHSNTILILQASYNHNTLIIHGSQYQKLKVKMSIIYTIMDRTIVHLVILYSFFINFIAMFEAPKESGLPDF